MSDKRLRELRSAPGGRAPVQRPRGPSACRARAAIFTYGAAGRKVRARTLKMCQSWPHWLSGVDQYRAYA